MEGAQPTRVVKVAVIGAGPAGLTSAKQLAAAGLHPTVFERADGIGGVWREMTSFSDFPLKPTASLFPTCGEMEAYLADYVAHFDLGRFIRLRTEVVHLKRIDWSSPGTDRWLVTCKSGTLCALELSGRTGRTETLEFDAVLLCCGVFWNPNLPRFPGQESFKGEAIHSHIYRVPEPYADKDVLLVGIGNSALDISLDLAQVARSVTISARSGSLILSVEEAGQATDQKLLSRAAQRMAPEERMQLFLSFQLTTAFMQHGMPPPPRRPEHAHHSLVKKKDEYIARLEEGKIKIKPNIQRIDGDKITFVDQTVMENCGAIIFCTGYNLTFPFIDDVSLLPGMEAGRLDLYKKVFHPFHPTLAFIAHVDAIGSIFAISEMQSRWVAKVGPREQDSAASQTTMLADIEKHKQRLAVVKPKYPMFVSYPNYMDELAQRIGCLPTPHKHLHQGRVKQILDDGPLLPTTYRLHGDDHWPHAGPTLARL
ncbi:Flavin-binding monooxygenase subfamily protein [Acanthamoeba castellanii str. Neff]|uniref:Flavin-binding monooxygenase subfamily protein n=1 Tax=Acanthamoeba castellanii (strain ATCC 30010 / Neff) TaxID=1257118 RepID=L8GRC0_ACACF|nr:Flavin-binding monooxygenase subfamily protein [Acanthamoeba castellanii str. Neff]ELR15482.1 Flavin-binding monooxygenase subfamily protein [Acanthamoeba castellanii str. Neff]